jgi:hypothetical protein
MVRAAALTIGCSQGAICAGFHRSSSTGDTRSDFVQNGGSMNALILAVAFLLAAGVSPPRPGDLAPDFKLVDAKGKSITLSSLRGETVVLVFYRGHW